MVQNLRILSRLIDFYIVAGLWFCCFVNILSPSLNRIALYAIIPSIFVISVYRNRGFKTNVYNNYVIFLCLWCLFSYQWALFKDAAITELHQLLGVFLVTFIFASNAKHQRLIPWLYMSYLCLLANCLIYAQNHIVFAGVSAVNAERLNDDVLDANTFSYYTVFCTFLTFILSKVQFRYKNVMFMLFLFMIPFTVYISLRTASRQILILQIPFFVALIYLGYFFRHKLWVKLRLFTIVILCYFFLYDYLWNIIENSYLYERSQLDLEQDSHIRLIENAYEIGWEHFPFGVGTGNYIEYSFSHHFSHTTYTELWANVGVVGVFLFVSLILHFCYKQWIRYRQSDDVTYLYFLAFGLVFIFQNLFYSFYTGLWLMGFFILVASHSETYFRNHI